MFDSTAKGYCSVALVALLIFSNSWAGECPPEVGMYCGKWKIGPFTNPAEKARLMDHISEGHEFDIEQLGSGNQPNLWISPKGNLRKLWIGQDRRLQVIPGTGESPRCLVATIKLRTGHGFLSKKWHQVVFVEKNNVIEIHLASTFWESLPDDCPDPKHDHAGRAHANEN